MKTPIMNTKYILISLFAIVTTLAISISTTEAQPSTNKYTSQHIVERDTAMLAFRSGKDVLYASYKNNDQELKNILAFVSNHSASLKNGASHINVVAYIKKDKVNDPIAVNIASIQASIVRAQFKLKYKVPHNAITFSIDTALNINNIVRVDYVNKPVRKYKNNSIHYTLNRNNVQLAKAEMAKYKPSVPYTNYIMRLVNENPLQALGLEASKEGDLVVINMGETTTREKEPVALPIYVEPTPIKEPNRQPADEIATLIAAKIAQRIEEQKTQEIIPEVTPEIIQITAPETAPETTPETTPETEVQPTEKTTDEYDVKTEIKYININEKNVVGVKTNLLQWATATPNIGLEFYMGQHISLELEGSYTWAWFLNEKQKAYYKWNVGAEVKYWLKPGEFNGHAIGLHTTIGEYDMKFKSDGVGKQGNYWAIGATYNYMMPIGQYFNIEFALGLGYAQYDLLKYQYNPGSDVNIEINSKNKQNYFGPTKAKIALVWKF